MDIVCCFGEKTVILSVPEDADFDMLQQLLCSEFGLPVAELVIQHNGKDVMGTSAATKVVELGMKGNDILMLSRKQRRLTINDVRLDAKPEDVIALVREHPYLQTQFNNADPELGSAIETGDPKALGRLIMSRVMNHNKAKFVKDQELRQIQADPDNEENQRAMMERIRQENVNQNMEMAMEELPEAFGRVIMLYVDLEINGHKIKAFVDSGAQSTIMSVNCAERCGLMRLLDTRYAGEARGVGTAKILGRVHMAQMKIGSSHLPISLTVLEKNDVDFLFGLDMLKRYRCQIDLADNCLRIDEGRECVGFLAENALPTAARGTLPEEVHAPTGQSDTSMDVQKESTTESEGTKAANPSTPLPPPPSAPSASSAAAIDSSTSASSPTRAAASSGAIEELVSMGFSHQQAQAALDQTGGDVEHAASLLLAQHD